MSSSPSGREVKSGLGITVTSLCVTHTGLYIRELIEKIRSGPRAVDPPPVVARLCNSALWVALIFGLHMPPLALRTAAPVSAGGGGFEGGEEGLLGKKREGSRRGSAHKRIHTYTHTVSLFQPNCPSAQQKRFSCSLLVPFVHIVVEGMLMGSGHCLSSTSLHVSSLKLVWYCL